MPMRATELAEIGLPNYQALREIHRGGRSVVFRARRASDGRTVVLKTLRQDARNAVGADALQRERALLRRLDDIPGVVRVLAMYRAAEAPVLVLEDAGASSLGEQLRGRPLSTERFLDLAIAIAEILARVHERGVVHHDINPSSFVLGPEGRPVLVDFEVATAVEQPVEAAPMEGTLPYVSPEQTGRTGRRVDHRSDLYSLGATFYEMLTGAPPFRSLDPSKIVHAHLARMPVAPATLDPAIPAGVSDIVLALLAKDPDARYQSAGALAVDLTEARRRWRAEGAVPSFRLERTGAPRELELPDELFEREREREELRRAFEAARKGAHELVIITGPSGIGKTALVNELRAHVTARGACFAAGKLDQRRAAPLAAIRAALEEAAADLLEQPDAGLVGARLRESLGPNAAIITALVPRLLPLVGEAPPVAEVGPVESEVRSHLTIAACVRALASARRPLVLFLDDLQWADSTSARVLQALATDDRSRHVLLLGALRDDETGPQRPIARAIAAAREAGAPVRTVPLSGLRLEGLTALCARALRCDPARARELAGLLLGKTAGNPFFVRHLLRSLHNERVLSFDPASGQWSYERASLQQVAVTDNVVDLLVARVRRLPEDTLRLVELAACLGRHVDASVIDAVSGRTPEEVARTLRPALDEGLLARRATPPAYVFAHDRVLQAAYEQIDAEQRQRLHLAIGSRLERTGAEQEREARLFEIVDQLDRGAALLEGDEERLRLAERNLRAAAKARGAAAYGVALSYLTRGLSLLPPAAWHTHYELCLRMHRDAAECAYLADEHARTDRLARVALAHARSRLEKADLIGLEVVASSMDRRYAKAIEWARQGLALFGADLPERGFDRALDDELAVALEALRSRKPAQLLELPSMSDPEGLAVIRLLQEVAAAVWFQEPALYPVVVTRMVNLSLRKGAAPASAYAYAAFGSVLGWARGDFALGHAIGQVGAELGRRQADPSLGCRAVFAFGALANAFGAPLRSSAALLREAFSMGMESGETRYAGHATLMLCLTLYAMGAPLAQVLDHCERAIAFGRTHGVRHVVELAAAIRQAARCGLGRTESPARFDDADFDEASYLRSIEGNRTALCIYQTLRLDACMRAGEIEEALAWSERAAENLPFARIVTEPIEHAFCTGLALAARADSAAGDERAAFVSELKQRERELAVWADRCPENFAYQRDLLGAELARLAGRHLEALALYDQCIDGAVREGSLRAEALGAELAGRSLAALGRRRIAANYLAIAADAYARWGANARAALLGDEAARLAPSRGAAMIWARTPISGGAALDLSSILGAAEAISAEVVLSSLLERLVSVCLQAAGAERGAIVLKENGALFVRAAGGASEAEPIAVVRAPLATSRHVPRSAIEHVHRSGEALVVDDARADARFSRDPYVVAHGVRSMLAMPIARKTEPIGIFYCENTLSTHAFPPPRLRVLRLLSGQIAVSLDNSLLFERLTREIEERTRAQRALRFLADASVVMGRSLDYAQTLAEVGGLVVPFLADWCVIDVIEEDGGIRRVVGAHPQAEKAELLRLLSERYPLRAGSPQPAAQVIRSGAPLLFPEVTDAVLATHAYDAEHARIMRELGTSTAMAVPLRTGERLLGVMSFASAQPGRRYGRADLELAEELARRGAVAIQNARLYRDAREAIRVRDEFLSVASHELRTPITSLQLSVQGLTLGVVPPSPEAVVKTLGCAERQIHRLTSLVDGLLDVSRIQSQLLELHVEEVELTELARSAVERLGPQAARAGCSVSVRADAPVSGRWDGERLEHMVVNLLDNAIKFGAGKPIEITVEREGDAARLVVVDHGIGIAPERVPHIFERFERAVSARHYGGLGLGLYIARAIAEAHGGSIRAESGAGVGTRMIVELPRPRV